MLNFLSQGFRFYPARVQKMTYDFTAYVKVEKGKTKAEGWIRTLAIWMGIKPHPESTKGWTRCDEYENFKC
jgi:hypothetical protein